MEVDPRWRATDEGARLRGFVLRRDPAGLVRGERLPIGYWSQDDRAAFRAWALAHYCAMFQAEPASLVIEIETLAG